MNDVLTIFLAELRTQSPKDFERFTNALRELNSPGGLDFIELLDAAVTRSNPAAGVSDTALREMHGRRLLVAEIRRLARNGIQVTESKRKMR